MDNNYILYFVNQTAEKYKSSARTALSNLLPERVDKFAKKNFTLEEILGMYESAKNVRDAKIYLMCCVISKGENDAPLNNQRLLEVIRVFNELHNELQLQKMCICDSINSMLMAQATSCNNLKEVLSLADLIVKINRKFDTNYKSPWGVLEAKFSAGIYELLNSDKTGASLLEALNDLVIAATIGLSQDVASIIVCKSLDYIKNSPKSELNNKLYRNENYSRDIGMKLNGLLRILKVSENFTLREQMQMVNENYRFIDIQLKVKEKLELDFTEFKLVDICAENQVSSLSELQIEQDPIKINRSESYITMIYRARIIKNNTICVVKRIKVKKAEDLEKYQKEILLLQRVSGFPYFLKYYGSFTQTNELNIVMEYIQESLSDIIYQGKFAENEVVKEFIIDKLIRIFTTLETNRIYHRDIKPENILIRDDNIPVVIDFGISEYKDLQAISDNVTNIYLPQGTIAYASPELFRELTEKKSFFSKTLSFFGSDEIGIKINPLKSDVYSLGLTIYTFFTGNDITGNQTVDGNQKLISKIHDDIKIPYLKELLCEMLRYDPKKRLTFNTLLSLLPVDATVRV